MDKVSLARVANAGLTVLRADTKTKRIMYLSPKNPGRWKVYEEGFKDEKSVDRRMHDILTEHRNYVRV